MFKYIAQIVQLKGGVVQFKFNTVEKFEAENSAKALKQAVEYWQGVIASGQDSGEFVFSYGNRIWVDDYEWRVNVKEIKSVRKNHGVFPVWCVAHKPDEFDQRDEVRYATKVDALDYQQRCGGELFWETFQTREEAQKYLEASAGTIWW